MKAFRPNLSLVKVIVGSALLAASTIANAAQVILLSHQQTSASGTISTLITDGSHIQGQPASTAVFDWDGSILTSTGLYSAVSSLGSAPFTPTIVNDQITDLTIDTGTGTATATAYTCVEGTFLAAVGASGCGGYNFGPNFIDESTTSWGPGLAFSRTIGGDDEAFQPQRSIAAYDFGTVILLTGSSTTTDDATFSIGNGIPIGAPNGEALTFEVLSFAPDVTITINGGNSQECTETNGSTVEFTANIVLGSADDALDSVEWFLDGSSIGFGQNVNAFVPLGFNTAEVIVTTILGETGTAMESIDIEDTTAPNISISFSDKAGNVITSIDKKGSSRIQLNYEVNDVCDRVPSVSATAGADVDNGQKVSIQATRNRIALDAESLKLHVTATDTSGNVAEQEAVLPIED